MLNKSLLSIALVAGLYGGAAAAQEWNWKTAKYQKGQVVVKNRFGQDVQLSLNEATGDSGASTPPMIVVESGGEGQLPELKEFGAIGKVRTGDAEDTVAVYDLDGNQFSVSKSWFDARYSYTVVTANGNAAVYSHGNGAKTTFHMGLKGNLRALSSYSASSNANCSMSIHWYDNTSNNLYWYNADPAPHSVTQSGTVSENVICERKRYLYGSTIETGFGLTVGAIAKATVSTGNTQGAGHSYEANFQVEASCIARLGFPNGQMRENAYTDPAYSYYNVLGYGSSTIWTRENISMSYGDQVNSYTFEDDLCYGYFGIQYLKDAFGNYYFPIRETDPRDNAEDVGSSFASYVYSHSSTPAGYLYSASTGVVDVESNAGINSLYGFNCYQTDDIDMSIVCWSGYNGYNGRGISYWIFDGVSQAWTNYDVAGISHQYVIKDIQPL